MNVAGLIFSNIHDANIPAFTRVRTMASVPFGCRYRLIDFALSNMVNSKITNIGVIAHHNYQSLMDHIGTGKDWDLARRSGGIKILPPYGAGYEGNGSVGLYETRLEALQCAATFIERCKADYIVLSDSDSVCNIDLSDVIEFHRNNGAFMTLVAKKVNAEDIKFDTLTHILQLNGNTVTDILNGSRLSSGNIWLNTNIAVIGREDLQHLILEASIHGYKYFYAESVKKALDTQKVLAYQFDGQYLQMSSLEKYYQHSMSLLEENVRDDLLGKSSGRGIYTKIRNSATTRYFEEAYVKNSLIADGCTIEGYVENSIIFRGVHIGKGSVVRNCVLLQDTYVGTEVFLNSVITDKGVVIRDGRQLSGHSTLPFFIGKNKEV